MSIKHYLQSSGYRPDPTKLGKIIDVGGANSFGHGHLDAIVEIRQPQAACNNLFLGDMDQPDVWDKVLQYAADYGQWDYAICTHTLEDIHNPMYVCRMMQVIAKRGFIAVPSKYRELSRFSSPVFRGYIHHLWIWDIVDGKLTGFPKINYIEDSWFDMAVEKLEGQDELVVEWEGRIDMQYINDGLPYGTAEISGEEHIAQLYRKLLV